MSERRIIYPPMWLAFGVCAIFAIDAWGPGPRFAGGTAQLVGGVVLVAGLAVLVVSGGLFSRAGTGMIPFRDTRVLVTHGVYRFSRNPMYLGMTVVLLGVSITVGGGLTLLVPPLFMAVIEWRYIRPEERQLLSLFGDDYRAYCRRVRRWL